MLNEKKGRFHTLISFRAILKTEYAIEGRGISKSV
jgi:hypothetical protein